MKNQFEKSHLMLLREDLIQEQGDFGCYETIEITPVIIRNLSGYWDGFRLIGKMYDGTGVEIAITNKDILNWITHQLEYAERDY